MNILGMGNDSTREALGERDKDYRAVVSGSTLRRNSLGSGTQTTTAMKHLAATARHGGFRHIMYSSLKR